MVRLFHAYFPTRTLFLAASEAFLIFSAIVAAVFLRFGSDTRYALSSEHGLLKVALVSGVCLLCAYYHDLYDSLVVSNQREVFARLIQVLGTACVILGLLYYAYPEVELGRSISLIGIVLAGIALVLSRELFFALIRSPRLAERGILLGEGPLAKAVANEIEQRPELGVRLSGYVGETSDSRVSLNGLRCLGALEELVPLARQARVDRIIVAMNDRRGKLPTAQLLQLKTQGVFIEDGADFYEISTGKVPLEGLRPSGLLFCNGFRLGPTMLLYKRVFSLVFSALGLLLSLPLMLVTALAIRLDSPGPAIFRQPRVGKDRRLFTLFKFRTMYVGADSDGPPKPAQQKDDRVTRVGRWLRRCRLDELPQLFNILRGDMYFVGPRPFVPNQEEELARQIPFYAHRWVVKPGATGWAQIHRGYNATLEENREKLAYDLFYVKNMSVGLDLLILFQTAKILLLGRGGR